MTIIQSMILGLVEGATEFLPVSSSGHMLIARALMHLPLEGTLAYDAVLQLAAALALVIYFWRDIIEIIYTFFDMVRGKVVDEKEKTLIYAIIYGTIPAVILGLLFQKTLDTVFRSVQLVGWATLGGAVLIYIAQKVNEKLSHRGKALGTGSQGLASVTANEPLTAKKGFVIGLFQCFALIPGVSRSGATISGGLMTGLSREDAVHFSFLMSVPILVGSGLYELLHIKGQLGGASVSALLAGSVVSFVVALAAIHYFIKFLKNHNFNIFVWYRIALFVAILFLF